VVAAKPPTRCPLFRILVSFQRRPERFTYVGTEGGRGEDFRVFAPMKDPELRVEVRIHNEMVWLSLTQLADLFQRDKSVISRHIKNVFEERELSRESVVANSATTAADGKTYRVEFYNLDVIISVGYRVKSQRGTVSRHYAP
jgi:hypothetical protein